MSDARKPAAPPAELVATAAVPTLDTPRAISRLRGKKLGGFYWGTGRRKSSVARVRIREGTGVFMVNDKNGDVFFTTPQTRMDVVSPLVALQAEKKWDVFVNVNGGGPTGQAGAIRMGLARALMNADDTAEQPMRDAGFLTRDSRMKERKKYGQRGARRRFQFSKR